MKFLFLSYLLTITLLAQASQSKIPKSFLIGSEKAVFVDFTEATYEITYDIARKKAIATAFIKFTAPEAGMPIFDSVQSPTTILLDEEVVQATLTKTPSAETQLRVIKKAVEIGDHTLQITLPLTELVTFTSTSVKSAFWTSDLDDRSFLESYLPANLEFDQVKMDFIVKFIGGSKKQLIYTNGLMKEINPNEFKISYPSYYTSSSIFFHTTTADEVKELRFVLKSIDGRDIPTVVYTRTGFLSSSLEPLKNKTSAVFHELESDYGPFPHPSITVYQAGSGGMEYCGATMTDLSALGHELFHSYFARAMMPANGNAGWLDEALASWRDDGYLSRSTLSGTSGMSNHLYYTRTTDTAAYGFGARFMSFMDAKVSSKGGLKPFLSHMIEYRKFSPILVEDFIQEMNLFYSMSFDADFQKYTFDTNKAAPTNRVKTESKFHPKMTIEQLQSFL